MSMWWRVQTAVAAAGIAAAGAVLTWSLLGLRPVLSPQGASILWGIAMFIWGVALLTFNVPLFAGHIPDDPRVLSFSPTVSSRGQWHLQKALWARASYLEAAAAIAPIWLGVPSLWFQADSADPGSPARIQLFATIAALACISATALSVIGSRPVDVERFGHPHQRRPPAPN